VQAGAKVNINTASAEELETLPGVGPAMAQKILEYRKANGPFKRVEELLNIKGIGEKSFQRMKDKVTVGS
jgi:competence protein ComEA